MTSGAAAVRDELRRHRLAPRRQFVDHRDVEVGIERHRQRARDRRRAHHQLVRQQPVGTLAQREPLGDAEAVLLVDDGKRHPLEDDRLLDQRMGADQEVDLSGRHRLAHLLLGARRQRAGEPAHPYRLRGQPGNQLVAMLLRQDLRRRHQRSLVARADGLHRGKRRDDRLAAADVALQQPVHRLRAGEVGADLRPDALLRGRQA